MWQSIKAISECVTKLWSVKFIENFSKQWKKVVNSVIEEGRDKYRWVLIVLDKREIVNKIVQSKSDKTRHKYELNTNIVIFDWLIIGGSKTKNERVT